MRAMSVAARFKYNTAANEMYLICAIITHKTALLIT